MLYRRRQFSADGVIADQNHACTVTMDHNHLACCHQKNDVAQIFVGCKTCKCCLIGLSVLALRCISYTYTCNFSCVELEHEKLSREPESNTCQELKEPSVQESSGVSSLRGIEARF